VGNESGEDMFLAYCVVLLRHMTKELRKAMKYLNDDNRSPDKT